MLRVYLHICLSYACHDGSVQGISFIKLDHSIASISKKENLESTSAAEDNSFLGFTRADVLTTISRSQALSTYIDNYNKQLESLRKFPCYDGSAQGD